MSAPARAVQQGGQQFTEFARQLEVEQERIDHARAEDAFTQLRAASIELSDGESGFSRKRGADAVKTPLLKDYGGKFDEAVTRISKELGSDRQRELFNRRSGLAKAQFQGSLLTHLGRENDTYQKQVFDDTIKVESANAWLATQRGETVLGSLSRIRAAADAEAARQGIASGSDSHTALRTEAESKLHLAVIDNALTAGKAQFAREYFDAYKGAMTTAALSAAEKAIKPITEFDAARKLGQEAIDQYKAGKPLEDVSAGLLAKARSKEEYTVAHSLLTQHDQEVRKGDAMQKGSLYEKFSRAPTRATMNAIFGSREYLNMNPALRGEVSEYLRHQVQSQEDHNRVLADRAEAKKMNDPQVFAAFYAYAQPEVLGAMERHQVLALRPSLGPQLTAQLMQEHGRIEKEGQQAARFQIDRDILNAAIPKTLLQPGADKQRLNAFRGIVESSLMDWKAKHPGKIPTKEEQAEIANAANAEYVQIGWLNRSRKAFDVKAENMARTVPKAFFDALKAAGASDDDIVFAWSTDPANPANKAKK